MILPSCFWTHSQCGIPLVFVFSCRHVNTCNMTTHNVKSRFRPLRNAWKHTSIFVFLFESVRTLQHTEHTEFVPLLTTQLSAEKIQCGGIWVSGAVLHAYSSVNLVCVHGPRVSSVWSLWKGQKWCSVSGMKNDLLMCEDFQMSLHHGVCLTYTQYLSWF